MRECGHLCVCSSQVPRPTHIDSTRNPVLPAPGKPLLERNLEMKLFFKKYERHFHVEK